MVEASAFPLTHLHIVTHLEWEREGQRTYEQQRAHLLDQVSQLLDDLQDEAQPLRHSLLSNQTIVLHDIAQVRADLLPTIAVYNANGRLSIGPWFVQLDEMLSSGEALVRSLLYGRDDARQHGVQLASVAYLPGLCHHPPQLPQILRGFGIDAALLCPLQQAVPLPFQWAAPDNTPILVIPYRQSRTIRLAILDQRESQPDGPYLWLQPTADWQATLSGAAAQHQSTLAAYVQQLRERFPDVLRPRLQREIWLPTERDQRGRYSARLDLKQRNAHLQAHLTHTVEPLLGLALAYGTGQHMANGRALLHDAWRTLLQNQTPTVSSGALSDAAYAATRYRHTRIVEESDYVLEKALAALPGQRQRRAADGQTTYITVWNPHGHTVKQGVTVALTLQADTYPETLLTPLFEELEFSWDLDAQALSFVAEVPPLGYAVYTVRLSRENLSDVYRKRIVAGRAIGNTRGEVLRINNGHLEWSTNQTIINNLITYVDGGDAGDIWHYAEPTPDVVMTGSIVDVVEVEATPVYDRLLFRSRMRIAPRLQEGQSRSRGLKVLDMTTVATYYADVPGLHFRTTFENTAEDHRLRVHIRTGISAQHLISDAAYGLTRHPLLPASPRPIQHLAALHNEQRGMALFTRGLPEVEPLPEDDQVTLGLTLLRAVGWLDKAAQIPAASAQMPGVMSGEFMLMPQAGALDAAQLLQTAQAYQAPLRGYQYAEAPPHRQHSYLTLEPADKLVLTALKPPQTGDGLVLRLLNPTDKPVAATLVTSQALARAEQVTLAETQPAPMQIKDDHQVRVVVHPHQVMTVCLHHA